MKGGARPGAGRKPGVSKIDERRRRVKCGMLRLPKWMLERLSSEHGRNRSRFIEAAILEATGWNEPD